MYLYYYYTEEEVINGTNFRFLDKVDDQFQCFSVFNLKYLKLIDNLLINS